jgi:hemerythrin-like domain-containing protein
VRAQDRSEGKTVADPGHRAIPEREFVEHEHQELLPGIDRLHAVGRMVGTVTSDDLSIALSDVIRWIESVLEPHAAWEDAWLYPEIAVRAGTPWATRLMTFEHLQIRELTRKLANDREGLRADPTGDRLMEVRAHLFGLEALLRAHVEREERFLIPLLDDEPVRVPVPG